MRQAEAVDPALFARAILHPRLKKPMRLVDHLYFVAEHDDHHLAFIWELLRDATPKAISGDRPALTVPVSE